jgi:hypothetical protein
LTCYQNGKEARFKREIFEKIFLRHCTNRDEYDDDLTFMQVEYHDGGRADIVLTNLSDEALALVVPEGPVSPEKMSEISDMPPGDPAFVQNVTFDHAGGDALFDDIYKLADSTNSVISWPDVGSPVAVPNDKTLKEVPRDYPGIKSARIVRSGTDLVKVITTDTRHRHIGDQR